MTELEEYGDPGIVSSHAKIPGWLKCIYVFFPIWGIIWFFLYWNGAHGWIDRGYWNELEKAANTTYPDVNYNDPKSQQRAQKS